MTDVTLWTLTKGAEPGAGSPRARCQALALNFGSSGTTTHARRRSTGTRLREVLFREVYRGEIVWKGSPSTPA